MVDAPPKLTPLVHPLVAGLPWRRFAHVPHMRPTKAHDLILRGIRRLGEWGVSIPSDSRIGRVEHLLRQWANPTGPLEDTQTRALIAEAIRTAVELHLATHGSSGGPDEMLTKKSREILTGADLSEQEQQHYERDIQFELHINGTLAAGGFAPHLDESPDIRFKLGGEDVGVAVKRIWSREQAHRRLSDAANQIEESGVRGIIATNVQQYLDVLPVDESIEVRGQSFNEQIARLHGQFPYLFGKKHVIGLLMCGTVAEWSAASADQQPKLRIATFNQLVTIGDDRDEESRLDALFAPFDEALRRWMELNL
jgi:hypothetical protein